MQQGRSGGVGFQRLLCQGCKWLQAGGAQPLQATAQAGAAPASAGAAAAGCKWWQVAFIFPASLSGRETNESNTTVMILARKS